MMNKPFFLLTITIVSCIASFAQTDTIRVGDGKLNVSKVRPMSHSYAVYFTDSAGNRISTADIWDREVKMVQGPSGFVQYVFEWKWYRRDSLQLQTKATCAWPSLQPVRYDFYKNGAAAAAIQYGSRSVDFKTKSKTTGADTSVHIALDMDAFVFPMDLELFALLPFKKAGEQYVLPFYEPGSPKAGYYTYTYTGKEEVLIAGDIKVPCWVLKADHGANGYSLFYIAQSGREVIKMQDYFKGKYRYKVKLY